MAVAILSLILISLFAIGVIGGYVWAWVTIRADFLYASSEAEAYAAAYSERLRYGQIHHIWQEHERVRAARHPCVRRIEDRSRSVAVDSPSSDEVFDPPPVYEPTSESFYESRMGRASTDLLLPPGLSTRTYDSVLVDHAGLSPSPPSYSEYCGLPTEDEIEIQREEHRGRPSCRVFARSQIMSDDEEALWDS